MNRARLICAVALLILPLATRAQLPAYRHRLLGVFDSQSGEPIEGAEVADVMQKNKSVTTKTGTVTMAYLPDGGSLVRIQKVGYQPKQMFVAISEADTVPMTVLLDKVATVLPAVVTRDSGRKYLSPALNAFEERRRSNAGGHFITEAELRKADSRRMTEVVRQLPGLQMRCPKYPAPRSGECYPVSFRSHGDCVIAVYVDGVPYSDNDLNKFQVPEYAAVEFYAGAASVPPEFNKTGSACGVLLFWTREK
jgi:hypothetical protein